jgi:hypothetical protein
MTFRIYTDLCDCKIETDPNILLCNNGVNLFNYDSPPETEYIESKNVNVNLGFSFKPTLYDIKITKILFPINLFSGVGNIREFGIWTDENKSTPFFTGIINKTTAVTENGFYVFKLKSPLTLIKNKLYIYGCFMLFGDSYYWQSQPNYINIFDQIIFLYKVSTVLECPVESSSTTPVGSFFSYTALLC